MSIKKLFAILIALSVLFAPGATSAAMAAVPGHEMASMSSGHCAGAPAPSSDHKKSPVKNCCVSTCTAIAVAPAAKVESAALASTPMVFIPYQSDRGLLREIATPPPRFA